MHLQTLCCSFLPLVCLFFIGRSTTLASLSYPRLTTAVLKSSSLVIHSIVSSQLLLNNSSIFRAQHCASCSDDPFLISRNFSSQLALKYRLEASTTSVSDPRGSAKSCGILFFVCSAHHLLIMFVASTFFV